ETFPMRIPFSCPSCGAEGSVDAAFAGKSARCKHCRHHFTIPRPDEQESESYALDEPTGEAAGASVSRAPAGSVFVPSRGDNAADDAPRKPMRTARTPAGREPKPKAKLKPGIAWRSWLVRLGVVAALVLAATALLAPNGTLI